MRMRSSSCLIFLLAVSCTTAAPVDDELAIAPPVPTTVIQTDPRVGELHVMVNELLDRIEVLNARIQTLERTSAAEDAGTRRESSPASVTEERPRALPPEPAPPQQDPVPVATSRSNTELSPALVGAAIADQYRSGITLFGRGKLDDSRRTFQAVFDTDPTGELADNALFWIAETWFVRGKYSESLRLYQQIGRDYADQNKAPDAMLKMGMTYVKLGDLDLAKKTFQQLIDRHPYTVPAATARTELKRIRY